jgi:hypothetical protein
MSQARKVFSFATMMVLAQRRHDARQAMAPHGAAPRDAQVHHSPETVAGAGFTSHATQPTRGASLGVPVLAASGRTRI